MMPNLTTDLTGRPDDKEVALIEAGQGGGSQSWDYPSAFDMSPLSPRSRPEWDPDA